MKRVFLLTIFFITINNLFAVNDLSLKAGVHFTSDKDLVWSPVTTGTFAPIGEISYSVGNRDGYHDLNMFVSTGEIKSEISEIPIWGGEEYGEYLRRDQLIMSDIDYSYNPRVAESDGYSFFIGIGAEIDVQMVLGYYTLGTINTSLNVGINVNKSVGNHEFGGSLMVPVLTYLNRPPYTGTDDIVMDMASNNMFGLLTMGELTSVFDYFNIDLSLNHKYAITENIKTDSDLNFAYTYIDTPRVKRMVETSFLTGIAYDFEGDNR